MKKPPETIRFQTACVGAASIGGCFLIGRQLALCLAKPLPLATAKAYAADIVCQKSPVKPPPENTLTASVMMAAMMLFPRAAVQLIAPVTTAFGLVHFLIVISISVAGQCAAGRTD